MLNVEPMKRRLLHKIGLFREKTNNEKAVVAATLTTIKLNDWIEKLLSVDWSANIRRIGKQLYCPTKLHTNFYKQRWKTPYDVKYHAKITD